VVMRERGCDFRRVGALFLVGAVLFLGLPGRADDVPFIRGDANGDGALTISDSFNILAYLFRLSPVHQLQCPEAADANFSGGGDWGPWSSVDIADAAAVLSYLFLAGEWRFMIPEPFPEPGFVHYDEELIGCDVYGGGEPVPDPGATMTVLDATAAGGEDPTVVIAVRVTNTLAIGGFSGAIRLPEGISATVWEKTVYSVSAGYFSTAVIFGGAIRFGFISDLMAKDKPLLAGSTDFRFSLHLAEGTTAGRYELALEEGELIDWESGQRILPAVTGGALVIENDIAGPPPPPPPPDTVTKAIYRLGNAFAAPGEDVIVPFFLWADHPVQAYQVAVDFDEGVLRATGIEEVWKRPDGEEIDFRSYQFNNDDPAGGDLGVITCLAVPDLRIAIELPAETEIEVLRFRFVVDPAASAASTVLRFVDNLKVGESMLSVINAVTSDASSFAPELMEAFVFMEGRVNIIGDVALFVRGDSNGSFEVDISDPVFLLSHLFLGGPPPSCADAADADDNGELDVTDAIYVLSHLFLGGKALPPPAGILGPDPTTDDLACRQRS
jgi:hypothetical protein